MKNVIKKSFERGGLALLLLMVLCAIIGVADGGSVCAADVTGVYPAGTAPVGSVATTPGRDGAGEHLPAGSEVTVDVTQKVTDQVLMSQYDSDIIQFRPYKSPLDTLLRYCTARDTNSLVVRWGSSDIKAFSANVTAVSLDTDKVTATITVDNNKIFARTSTIRVDGIYGYEADKTTRSTKNYLQLYVKEIDSIGRLVCLATNGVTVAGYRELGFPFTVNNSVAVCDITPGTKLYRLGRAAYEKDVKTPSYAAYPSVEENYIQCFKCQVDISKWYQKHAKLLEWDRQDIELAAIYEYKLETEGTLLYGTRGITYDSSEDKGDVYTCNGVTKYINTEFGYTTFTKNDLVDLTKTVFSGNTGSDRRVLFAGSGLMANISKIDYTQFKDITFNKEVVWGIKWNTINTNFGTIYMIHHEALDNYGDENNGYVIDPEYLVRYVWEQENKKNIDQSLDGTANVDSSITTEAWCPGLKYSNCHLKIVME